MRKFLLNLWGQISIKEPVTKIFHLTRGSNRIISILKPGETLLDVGTSFGHSVDFFSKQGIHTIGLDLDKISLLQAKRAFPELQFVLGDATRLPFREKSFDSVLLSYTIHHLPQAMNPLEKMLAMAKKRIIIVEMRKNRFLKALDTIWDSFLPYPSYNINLEPIKPILKIDSGFNTISVFRVPRNPRFHS